MKLSTLPWGFNPSPVNTRNARVAESVSTIAFYQHRASSQGTDLRFKGRPIRPLSKRAERQLVLSSISLWTHGRPAYSSRTLLSVEIQEGPMTTTADNKRVPPIVRATSPVIPGSKRMFANPKIFTKQYAPYVISPRFWACTLPPIPLRLSQRQGRFKPLDASHGKAGCGSRTQHS